MARTVDPKLLAEIVGRITRVAKPRKIILFGSAATGEMTPDSDIDLLVLEATGENPRKRMVLYQDQLVGLGYPFDVIVMDPDKYERSKDVLGGLAYPANKYGKVIYDAA